MSLITPFALSVAPFTCSNIGCYDLLAIHRPLYLNSGAALSCSTIAFIVACHFLLESLPLIRTSEGSHRPKGLIAISSICPIFLFSLS
jgi:hypothetical protein